MLTWLRLSTNRQLDWYRNSNYQGKDMAHVQKTLAQRMADMVRAAFCPNVPTLPACPASLPCQPALPACPACSGRPPWPAGLAAAPLGRGRCWLVCR